MKISALWPITFSFKIDGLIATVVYLNERESFTMFKDPACKREACKVETPPGWSAPSLRAAKALAKRSYNEAYRPGLVKR